MYRSGMHDLPGHAPCSRGHAAGDINPCAHALDACPDKRTRHDVLGAAQVDDQIAANTPEAGLQVEHSLQEELGAEGSGLGVPKGRQLVLPRVKAVQWHNLHTGVSSHTKSRFYLQMNSCHTEQPGHHDLSVLLNCHEAY